MKQGGSANALDTIMLGSSHGGDIILRSHQDQQNGILRMATQAGKRMLIFSYALEPYLYDSAAFITACKNMVIRHPQCHARILIQNNENLRNLEHRLVTLVQRLPSRIELKLCHEDYSRHPSTFFIADSAGIFIKHTTGKSLASINFNAPAMVDEYSRFFYEVWEQSAVDPTLRRLSL